MTAFDKKKGSAGSGKRTSDKAKRAPERPAERGGKRKPAAKGTNAARARITARANPIDRGERGTTGPAAI